MYQIPIFFFLIKILGLFRGVISESGVSLAPWAITEPGVARRTAIKTAKSLKCPTDNTYEMLHCLQSVEVNNILSMYQRDVS